MKQDSQDRLKAVAKQLIWWKPPRNTLAYPERLIAHVEISGISCAESHRFHPSSPAHPCDVWTAVRITTLRPHWKWFRKGIFGWALTNPRRLKFRPCKGAFGAVPAKIQKRRTAVLVSYWVKCKSSSISSLVMVLGLTSRRTSFCLCTAVNLEAT